MRSPRVCVELGVQLCLTLTSPSLHRVQQLEEENSHMSSGMCRLKSQTEKLDEVSVRSEASSRSLLFVIHIS